MIIYENKGFETRSDCPCEDWTGEAKYVVADGSELAAKIRSLYPYYDFVEEEGGLVDVIATELPAPSEEELRLQYEAQTVELVRELYTADDEAKVVREYLAQLAGAQAAFDAYNTYVLECKDRAHYEVYGDDVI